MKKHLLLLMALIWAVIPLGHAQTADPLKHNQSGSERTITFTGRIVESTDVSNLVVITPVTDIDGSIHYAVTSKITGSVLAQLPTMDAALAFVAQLNLSVVYRT